MKILRYGAIQVGKRTLAWGVNVEWLLMGPGGPLAAFQLCINAGRKNDTEELCVGHGVGVKWTNKQGPRSDVDGKRVGFDRCRSTA
eukprot:915570-Amphidinium_carterae.1